MATEREIPFFSARELASVTTYMQPSHPWSRVIETFVQTADGVRVYACAVPRDPTQRPWFRGITTTEKSHVAP